MNVGELTAETKTALEIYEALRQDMEAEHMGQAIAIHVDTRDFAIGSTHSAAAHELLKRHAADGRIVTLTIGPPTEKDLMLASRIAGSKL